MKQETPLIVVAACIIREDEEGDSILLAQRYKPESPAAHLKWELPGGKVEVGETPQRALIREIKEELNTTINIIRLLPHVQSNTFIHHCIVLAFECFLAEDALPPMPSVVAIEKIRWVPVKEAQQLDLLPGTIPFLECLEYDLVQRC